jgi:hypothetical protein
MLPVWLRHDGFGPLSDGRVQRVCGEDKVPPNWLFQMVDKELPHWITYDDFDTVVRLLVLLKGTSITANHFFFCTIQVFYFI